MKKLTNLSLKNYFLISLFIAICVIVYFLPISSAFIAQGFLSYDTQKKNIQHLEGGIVEKVLVKNGQEVIKNQEIVILSSLKPSVDRNNIRFKLLSLIIQKQLLELEGQRIDAINKMQLDNNIKLIIGTLNKQEKENIAYLMMISQQYLQASVHKYLADIKLYQHKKNILINNVKINTKKLKIIQYQLNAQKILVDKNFIEESLLLDLQKQELEVKTQIENLGQEINILEAQKSSFRHENIANIAKKIMDSSFDIAINSQNLQIAEDLFARTIIYAPIDGIIENIKISSQGEIVEPSKIILQIVPKNPDLVIIGKVKAVDIDNIKMHQKVEIFLKNFYEKNIPIMAGQITEISNDIYFDEDLHDYYYEIKIKIIQNNEIISVQNLKSGMAVDIFINQNKRNIFSYILAPILRSIKKSFNDLQ